MAKLATNRTRLVARQVADRTGGLVIAMRDRLQLQASMRVAEERDVRRWASRWLGLFWSVAIGVISCLLPLSLMAVLMPPSFAPAGAMIALIIIGLITYASDWKAAAAGITVSVLVLARWMTDDSPGQTFPEQSADRTILAMLILGGALLALVVERLKIEGSIDRQEILAARSAATALSAVESVAATRQNLSPEARLQLYEAIVRSVVGVNRAHAGALLLVDLETNELTPAALYGFGADAEAVLQADSEPGGLAARVQEERRTLQLSGMQRMSGARYAHFRKARVKSLLGAPVVSQSDQLLGVLLVGLLVDHRFNSQEVRKLDALASQVASILETMDVMGRREHQLRQARDEQHRLERLIAAVPEALVVSAPPSGAVVAMNRAAQHLFGDVPPESLLERIHPAGDESMPSITPTERALTFGDTANDVECVIDASDNRKIPVLASAAPIRDDDGTIVAVVSAFRDISALKEASRLKDEFVSVVSHELRSPLTPVRGFVQLVARELSREGGHELQVHRLESVSGHVDRLTRLVDDLLDVSRLRSGSLEIRTTTTDLVALCRQVVDAYVGSPAAAQLEFATEEATLHAELDPDRIHQVLDNLVLNAIKYSPPGARVVLTLHREDDQAVIEVSDRGPGIDDSQKAAIFGAFYRTPAAEVGQVQGLGLGLYICRELVEAHGGEIDVRSEENGGSTFLVRLPIHDVPDGPGNSSEDDAPVALIAPVELQELSASS